MADNNKKQAILDRINVERLNTKDMETDNKNVMDETNKLIEITENLLQTKVAEKIIFTENDNENNDSNDVIIGFIEIFRDALDTIDENISSPSFNEIKADKIVKKFNILIKNFRDLIKMGNDQIANYTDFGSLDNNLNSALLAVADALTHQNATFEKCVNNLENIFVDLVNIHFV